MGARGRGDLGGGRPPNEARGARLHRLVLAVPLAVGALIVMSTYGVFTQTWDEAAHVAAGIEWLDRGTYTYELLHPPLARIAVALGPFLDGARSQHRADIWKEGSAILHGGAGYQRTLTLARLGTLPFFMLCGALVGSWAAARFGTAAGQAAAWLFVTTPPVLAHVGLATTDMALAAGVTATTVAVDRGPANPRTSEPRSSGSRSGWPYYASSRLCCSCRRAGPW